MWHVCIYNYDPLGVYVCVYIFYYSLLHHELHAVHVSHSSFSKNCHILILIDSPARRHTGSTIGFMGTTLTSNSLNIAAQWDQSDQKWHLRCSPSMISMVVDIFPCAEEKKIEWLAQDTSSWHESMSGNENGSCRNESNHADLKLSTAYRDSKVNEFYNTPMQYQASLFGMQRSRRVASDTWQSCR